MPCICKFDGIFIYMYYNDHMLPHFHAICGGDEAIILISTLAIERGELSAAKLKLVHKWARMHRDELMKDWELARQMVTLKQIDPLE